MRTCDSVIRKCVVGGKSQHRKLRREIYSFFDTSITMALVQKREKDGRSVLACAKSDRNREPSSSSSVSGSPPL